MSQQQLLAGWTAAAQVLHVLQYAAATGPCLFAAPAKSVSLCTLRAVIPAAMGQASVGCCVAAKRLVGWVWFVVVVVVMMVG